MIDRAEVLKRIEKSMADWPYLAQCPEYTYEMLESAHKLLKEHESIVEVLKSDLDETLAVLGDQPEIVRCKECKHSGNSEKCVLSAISEEKDFPLFMLDNRGDWFCADGERKSNG